MNKSDRSRYSQKQKENTERDVERRRNRGGRERRKR
jgi:hypothetical protein